MTGLAPEAVMQAITEVAPKLGGREPGGQPPRLVSALFLAYVKLDITFPQNLVVALEDVTDQGNENGA